MSKKKKNIPNIPNPAFSVSSGNYTLGELEGFQDWKIDIKVKEVIISLKPLQS